MTRSRALPDGTPSDLAAEYYGQRASVGLIISEGTQPSDDGQGYSNTPGIYTGAHIKGWKKVTSKVRNEGGRIFVQLMHVGRVSHPDNTPHHRQATWLIANPDFVERLKLEAPLNAPDKNTIYAGGAEGYTDYPFLKE